MLSLAAQIDAMLRLQRQLFPGEATVAAQVVYLPTRLTSFAHEPDACAFCVLGLRAVSLIVNLLLMRGLMDISCSLQKS